MWSRLRRRTMSPRRPVLYPEQIPLAIVTAVLLVGGVAVVAVLLFAGR
jgi:hypothetical protein